MVEIRPAGDSGLLVTVGEAISLETHHRVLRLTSLLASVPGVRNIHPAYTSVLVTFDPLRTAPGELERRLREMAVLLDAAPLGQPRTVEIPVRYGGAEGPDLEEVARLHGMGPEQAAALHAGAEYTCYFLGFSPGFPYLGGLPESLATPRLVRPRRLVPAGSVAIGGNQTGVYPVASPGGWRIIGRTPLELFRPDREPPALVEMGDRVRFVPL